MKRLFVISLLGACVAPERVETGPEVHVRLSISGQSSITDETMNPGMVVDRVSGMYELDVEVTAAEGEREEKGSYDRVPVKTVVAALAVPNVNVPVMWELEGTDSKTLESKAKVIIPASAKGQIMTVTASAEDDAGLSSNQVSFGVMLR